MLLAYVYGDALKHDNGRVWSLDTGLRMAAAYQRGLLLRGRGVPRLPVEPPARGLHGSAQCRRLARTPTAYAMPHTRPRRGVVASIGHHREWRFDATFPTGAHVPKHRPKRARRRAKAAATGPARRAPAKTGGSQAPIVPAPQVVALAPADAGRRDGASPSSGSTSPTRGSSCPRRCRRSRPPTSTTATGICSRRCTARSNRTLVPLSQISPHMIDAVIATEDHDFYNHPGIDPMGILRAACTDIVKRRHRAGRLDASRSSSSRTSMPARTRPSADGVQTYVLPHALGPGEDPRGAARDQARAAARQGSDPREVPQHRLLRPRRLRGRGGRRDLLRQAREPAHRAGVGVARRRAARARALRSDRSPERQLVPSQLRDRPDGALRLPRRKAHGDRLEGAQVLRHGRRPSPTTWSRRGSRSTSSTTCGGSCSIGTASAVSTQAACASRPRWILQLQRAAENAIAAALPNPANDPAAALVSIDPRTGEILAMAGGRNWLRNKVNYATVPGRVGPAGRVGVQGVHPGRGDAAGIQPQRVLERPEHDRRSRDCPDSNQPDGIWHPVNAGDGEAGDVHPRRRDRALRQHGLRAGHRAARARERGRHGARPRHPLEASRRVLRDARGPSPSTRWR